MVWRRGRLARAGRRDEHARSSPMKRLRGRRNMIAGANKDDYHLRHVTPGEDFQPEYQDLRQVAAGDACANCGAPLQIAQDRRDRAHFQARLPVLGSRWACGC